jgi:hypothetical protein
MPMTSGAASVPQMLPDAERAQAGSARDVVTVNSGGS